jgi:hypothetical protein
MFGRFRNSAGALLVLALAGCSDKEITTYRVLKDAGAAAPSAPAAAAGAATAAPGLHWEAPAAWQTQAAGGLRAASFLAPGPGGATADVSVVTFGGAGGDTLANINRWRGQLKLPPITAEQMPAQVGALDAPAGHFSVADIRGEPEQGKAPARILGAWLEQPDRVWFFKMMGPDEVVESQKGAFMGFLKSVSPGAAPAAAAAVETAGPRTVANTNDLPSGEQPHAPFAVIPTEGAGASEASFRWQAPADWKPKPATAIRKGSFTVSRAGAEADMAITAFPGDVGGLAANVNRWRGQVGLEPVDASVLGTVTETFDSNGLQFTLVDVAGTTPSGQQRILAAIVPWKGGTWFFKMIGPAALVEDEKPAFVAFLRTVQPQ